jgi:hypothetical protein
MPFPGASRTEHIELLDAHNDNEASETVTHTMERASESSPLSESRRVQNGEDDADVSVAKRMSEKHTDLIESAIDVLSARHPTAALQPGRIVLSIRAHQQRLVTTSMGTCSLC